MCSIFNIQFLNKPNTLLANEEYIRFSTSVASPMDEIFKFSMVNYLSELCIISMFMQSLHAYNIEMALLVFVTINSFKKIFLLMMFLFPSYHLTV